MKPDSHPFTRRDFLKTSAVMTGVAVTQLAGASIKSAGVDLSQEHIAAVKRRQRRIVVQHDVYHVMRNYAKLHAQDVAPFEVFRQAVFSYIDEPGSQIDAVWWDIGGNTLGAVYPSKVLPPVEHPLLQQWLKTGIDWVQELVKATHQRKLEVFWNHRINELEGLPEGGLEMKRLNPLKAQHPDWVLRTFWWQGFLNLAVPEVRRYKLDILRELATRYDLDGIQIDFSRHVPCLPVGRQWELREHVTQFLREVRLMLLEVAQRRGRPILLAAKVPRNLEGCHTDGFEVATWASQKLVDVLTLGSRSMDVDVEAFRRVVGNAVQLQPCFDDHHATDGYRYGPIEFLRGVFANHWQRGADSVVAFNWAIGMPEIAKSMGGEVGPLTQQQAFREVGEMKTLTGKDKFFAVERRGGYPWAEGFFNRNDTAPLPQMLAYDGSPLELTIHASEAPVEAQAKVVLRCVLFQALATDIFEVHLNGVKLAGGMRDADWKDAQIFSPAAQPTSGGKGDYRINPKQRLLRIDWPVPNASLRVGTNLVTVSIVERGPFPPVAGIQLEKLELHLKYA